MVGYLLSLTRSKSRTKPCSFRICAIPRFSCEAGTSTVSWCADDAFRIRVSMSAIGSVIFIFFPLVDRQLPASLDDAWQLTAQREAPKANAAQAKLSDKRARTAANVTEVAVLYLILRLP